MTNTPTLNAITEISFCSELPKQIMYKIYDMVCIQKYSEQDMEDYLVYEGENKSKRIEAIKRVIECCQHFLVECALLREDPPEPAHIHIVSTLEHGEINPKLRINVVESKP